MQKCLMEERDVDSTFKAHNATTTTGAKTASHKLKNMDTKDKVDIVFKLVATVGGLITAFKILYELQEGRQQRQKIYGGNKPIQPGN